MDRDSSALLTVSPFTLFLSKRRLGYASAVTNSQFIVSIFFLNTMNTMLSLVKTSISSSKKKHLGSVFLTSLVFGAFVPVLETVPAGHKVKRAGNWCFIVAPHTPFSSPSAVVLYQCRHAHL